VTPADLESLCAAAMPEEQLSAAELERSCCGPDDRIIGDGDAVIVVRPSPMGGHVVLLLAVHPDHQRQGRARQLLSSVPGPLHAAGAAPFYLWPGIDVSNTPALATFEACGFQPTGASLNMGIDTAFRAPLPDGIVVEPGDGTGLATSHFPHWHDEVAAGPCWVAHANGDVVAFGCHSVNRRGWIGPMATHPDWRGRGVGHAVLSALCADLMTHGVAVGDIAWVGPVGFYAKAGARVTRVFRTATRPE